MTKGTYSHSNRHRMHEQDEKPETEWSNNMPLIEARPPQLKDLLDARAEILNLKRENAMLKERPDNKHKDTDYHDRLEREVTSLKHEVILLGTVNTKLTHDLNGCHRQIHDLRLDNEQLRQAIAVLNDEPTNSL